MKKHFLVFWNIGALLLFGIYVLCFTRLAAIDAKNGLPGPVNVVVIDFLGFSFWYLLYFSVAELTGLKWLARGLAICAGLVVIGVVYTNMRAWL